MKRLAFGIDFGTTNSIVAAWGEDIQSIGRNGKSMAFWAPEQRPHPSVVWYSAGRPPITGREARENMDAWENAIGNTFIRSVKRRLGRDEEIELVGSDRAQAWEVAAEIFRHLKRHAEESPALKKNRTEICECLVTVPVHFTGRQRRDIRRAMNHAGLQLTTFMHEPFAALIGQFYDPGQKLGALQGQKVLVFDWGGGTLDLCLVQISKDGRQIYELSHDGIEDRAGDDFDHRIMTYLKDRFVRSGNVSIEQLQLDGPTRGRFWIRSERAKIALSSQTRASVDVPQFMTFRGKVFNLQDEVTRAAFETLIQDEIEAARVCTLRCLEKGGVTPGLVDRVLMVGGSSNVPAVRTMIESVFGAKVHVAHEPDAAIARGAAIAAAEDWKPYNVKTIAVKLSDDTFFPVLEEGVPVDKVSGNTYTFYCTDHRPGAAHFFLYEREKHGDESYRPLNAKINVPTRAKITSIAGLDRIIAKFMVTEDLTLRCSAVSSSLGQERECEVHDFCFGLTTD